MKIRMKSGSMMAAMLMTLASLPSVVSLGDELVESVEDDEDKINIQIINRYPDEIEIYYRPAENHGIIWMPIAKLKTNEAVTVDTWVGHMFAAETINTIHKKITLEKEYYVRRNKPVWEITEQNPAFKDEPEYAALPISSEEDEEMAEEDDTNEDDTNEDDDNQKEDTIKQEFGLLEDLPAEIFPGIVNYQLPTPSTSIVVPMGAKFRNFYPYDLEFYYDDGTAQGAYNGIIKSMGRSAINTYATHSFFFCKKGTTERVDYKTMELGKTLILLQPDDPEQLAVVHKSQFFLDVMDEMFFHTEYKAQTGRPWLAYFPRPKPRLHMWPAEKIGDVHAIGDTNDGHPFDLKLVAISQEPRVFLVENLLSQDEVDFILKTAKDKVQRSAVGSASNGFVTDTRTSRTAWLSRDSSETMNKLYSRFAKVLNIPDEELTHDNTAENLQVVTYNVGQKYSPHHDFNDKGSPPQRFLTLFIYLKAADEKGGTGFPLAYDRRGMSVNPKPGSAVLWYNMLEDGNADELSLHEGEPVGAGEKWGCNLWVWDPKIKFN
mmetsp:Transcript_8370/g.15517  ORF Transcript_8370/g.15517 Transcript_8370/m.15517 type:complete len:546 (+) Transcript_8370:187-1824(+)